MKHNSDNNKPKIMNLIVFQGIKGVQYGVFKGVKDGPGPPPDSHKPVWALACLQGVDGSGMAGLDETLGSSWIPLPICLCFKE
jgi:hypothetical protein